METPATPRPLANSWAQKWQRLIRKQLWKMDIHPSTWIAATALIDRTWPQGIHIAEGCIIDHHAVILTHDMTRGLYLHTYVGERSTIGARAIILPGVRIGKDCRIAPGSLVNRDLADGAQVMGNPARALD